MKIFSAAQIKNWDSFTIANEPVSSIDLMERAAAKCCDWLLQHEYFQKRFLVFCGKGNNGGDGLAIARILIKNKYSVTVYILENGKKGTPDFQENLVRLHQCSTDIHFIQTPDFFPEIQKQDIIIDALYGTGLNKPLEGISSQLVHHINNSKAEIIAVDLPSGLFADSSSKGNMVINASITLSFQQYKLAFLLPENKNYCGQVYLLNIGLHKAFEVSENTIFELNEDTFIRQLYKPRNAFAHKGNFGHAALLCGSYGMMGAAILSARACLRAGAGKLTCYIPECGYSIVQTAVPEAMSSVTGDQYIVNAEGLDRFNAVGIGPGIGLHPTHTALLSYIFSKVQKPMLIDADALNILAQNKNLLVQIPALSILTPHPKEFENLFGKTENEFARLQLALEKSKAYNIYIVLKGHYTFISTPEGKGYFNNTGNAGMATAGSGDVLVGIITALLAQDYTPLQACLLGTWLHGKAGDFAAAKLSQEAMLAGDISDSLGDAFRALY